MNPAYTRPQIAVHWLIVALVALQWLTKNAMHVLWHAITGSETIPIGFGDQVRQALHMASGLTILFLALMLLFLRRRDGTPPLADLPEWARKAALWTHRGFYFVLIATPIFGTMAAAGIEAGALAHVVLTKLLLALVGLHLLGALWHLAIRRDGIVRGMIVPRG
ncbi:MAG TPA: cytochrome b/b6 domain-containing protein [Hyphomicrobiales bacterium]|nr:cytochrome b/b6 domain-containing protein [Hyphomicrobiales bacterium]